MCLQLLVFLLCALIFGCFTYEIAVIKPNWLDILKGLLPKPSVHPNPPLPMPITHRIHNTLYIESRADVHRHSC